MTRKRGQHGGPRPPRHPAPGIFSRNSSLASLDKRTKAGRLQREVEAALAQHCGGQPSATQQLVISSTGMLAVVMDAFADRLIGQMASMPINEVEALVTRLCTVANCLGRNAERLGMSPPAEVMPSLATYLEQRKAVASS